MHKNTSHIKDLLKFVEFTHKFQQIKRVIYVTGEDRNENDMEHSFQLALTAWYLVDSLKLNLNKEKIISYALAHDLVETYAGDVNFHHRTKEINKSKVQNEAAAAKRMKSEFPEFTQLHKTIENYEKKADEESRLVYALDKLLPVINIYLDKGRSWKADQITYEMVRHKDEKIAFSQDIAKLWMQLIPLLENHPEYFWQGGLQK